LTKLKSSDSSADFLQSGQIIFIPTVVSVT
jgi:hypothetical protein